MMIGCGNGGKHFPIYGKNSQNKVYCEEDWQADVRNGYAIPVDCIACESGVVLASNDDDAKNERQDWTNWEQPRFVR